MRDNKQVFKHKHLERRNTNMEQEQTFLNVQVPLSMMERIDDFRFEERKPSRAEAARQLLEMGLKVWERSTTKVKVAASKA